MKRQGVELETLAGWENLQLAVWKAAKGKTGRPDVVCFIQNIDENLAELQEQILNGRLPLQQYRSFRIRDPKPRKIVAVGFKLRVLHHAIMNLIGQNLERSQIDSSFACLPGRGVHAAVLRVQRGLRCAQWYVKIDIEKYFENIDHSCLQEKLRRRFKGGGFLALLDAIIDGYWERPGKGLPIGSLTSQYFANFYLEQCDRFILQLPETCGYVRYMDDMIWFCRDRQEARYSLEKVVDYLAEENLRVKESRQVQPVRHGVQYCGFCIQLHRILLPLRKKRSYRNHLKKLQEMWKHGWISSIAMQRGYAAVHGITSSAQSIGFRRSVLAQIEEVDV